MVKTYRQINNKNNLIYMTYIPKKFKLHEFLRSATAKNHKIENFPTWEIVEKLRILAQRLDIYRNALGSPIFVRSGYRCPELNVLVGGSKTSHHCKGDAADLDIGTGGKEDAIKLFIFIKRYNEEHNLAIDQLFLEHNTSTGSWWVHLGLNADEPEKMRNQYDIMYV